MENEEQIAALVRRGREIAAQTKLMTEELKDLKSKIQDLLPVGSAVLVDDRSARVKPGNRSFNPLLAMQIFTPDQRLSCITVTPTRNDTAVRELAKGLGITEQCMEPPPETSITVDLG